MASVTVARDTVGRPPRGVILLAMALLTALTCYAAAPLFVLPQLEPDDYRYLELVDDLRGGRIGFLQASIIENRWDHLWWIDIDAVVRFFRPTLFASYWFDTWLHGGVAAGLAATNVGLMFACCVLAAAVFFRVLAPAATDPDSRGWLPALLASALFAAFACHAECLWYIAGRNETLAAAPFLAALALHAWARRPTVRLLALPCFALALLGKEVTFALPVVALGLDRALAAPGTTLRACLRAQRLLYAGYAVVLVGYLIIRQAVLSAAGGSTLVAPYLHSPLAPGYVSHVALQLRAYAENLFLGAVTPPFLHAGVAEGVLVPGGALIVTVFAVLLLARLWREPRFWALASLAVLSWLPASVAYVSERYLLLPSFALAGIAGLWLCRVRVLGVVMVLVWIAHQAGVLQNKNSLLSQRQGETAALRTALAPLRGEIPRGARILFASFPGDVFHAQFAQSVLRRELADPTLECRIVSVLPDDPAQGLQAGRVSDRAFDLRAPRALMHKPAFPFPWRSLLPGTRIAAPRLWFAVEVLAGDGASAQHLRIALDAPLRDYVLVAFTPPEARGPMTRGQMIRRGTLRIVPL